MKRIKLSKTEKELLHLLNAGLANKITDIPNDKYVVAASSLKNKGLVKCFFLTNGRVWDIRLTLTGKIYLYENPCLHNPFNWRMSIFIIIMVIVFIALLKH